MRDFKQRIADLEGVVEEGQGEIKRLTTGLVEIKERQAQNMSMVNSLLAKPQKGCAPTAQQGTTSIAQPKKGRGIKRQPNAEGGPSATAKRAGRG